MIETLKYATISSIYTRNLIFYDPEKEEELIEKCKTRSITYLPAKNRRDIYKLTGKGFKSQKLTPELQCRPYDRIFTNHMVSKFRNGNHDEVLFVTENKKIKGVVHIVDYNEPFIYFEFYKLLFYFEQNLRTLLTKKGENNDSLLRWMKESENEYFKNKYKEHVPSDESKLRKVEGKRRDFGPFQTFSLGELLNFCASKTCFSDDLEKNIYKILSLRNWVAHNRDITFIKKKADTTPNAGEPLYSIKELNRFIRNANAFFNSYEELEALLNE